MNEDTSLSLGGDTVALVTDGQVGSGKGKWLTSQLGMRAAWTARPVFLPRPRPAFLAIEPLGTLADGPPMLPGHMGGAAPVSFLRVMGSGVGSPGQWTDGQDTLLLTSPTHLSLSKAPPMHTRAHTFWLTPMSPCALVLDLELLQNLLRKGR